MITDRDFTVITVVAPSGLKEAAAAAPAAAAARPGRSGRQEVSGPRVHPRASGPRRGALFVSGSGPFSRRAPLHRPHARRYPLRRASFGKPPPCCSSSVSAIRARRYAGNRHNIGFMALDAIARANKAAPWRRRFQGEATEAVDRRRAGHPAQARDLHERVRPRRGEAMRVLQDLAGDSWCSTTSSISRPPSCG